MLKQLRCKLVLQGLHQVLQLLFPRIIDHVGCLFALQRCRIVWRGHRSHVKQFVWQFKLLFTCTTELHHWLLLILVSCLKIVRLMLLGRCLGLVVIIITTCWLSIAEGAHRTTFAIHSSSLLHLIWLNLRLIYRSFMLCMLKLFVEIVGLLVACFGSPSTISFIGDQVTIHIYFVLS